MSEGERRPYHVPAGGGESAWTLGGRFTVKVSGEPAEDRWTLLEVLVTRSGEPPLHIHHREDEAFYLLEGAMTFHAGDEVVEARPGDLVFAPKDVPHAFRVDVEPSRVLLLASPSGFERFAMGLGEPATDDVPPPGLALPAPDVLAPAFERFGIEVVGPPIREMG